MRALGLALRRMSRAWLAGTGARAGAGAGAGAGWRGGGRVRRWVGAALVVVLVLTVAPAVSVGAGWGNPFSGVASWVGGLRDLVTGDDGPVRRGEARPGPEWTAPGRSEAVAAQQAKPPGKRVKELTDRRSATASLFQLDDGRLQAEVSAVPVHYRDSSGRWRDVDTRIVPLKSSSDGFIFGNDGTGFATRFGQRSDALVEVRLGDRWVRVGVAGPARRLTPVVKGSSVRYAGVWPGVDVVYDLTASGLKESIVLSGLPTGDPSFEFTVTTNGLDTRTMPDGSVGFVALGGASAGPVFSIPKPFMVDARVAATESAVRDWYSDAVDMVLGGSGAARSVTIRPDRAWLAAKDRVYPVVVDPTVTVQPDASTSQDAIVISDSPNTNYGNVPDLAVGVDPLGTLRSLVRFNLSGVVPPGTTVDAAALSLYWDNVFLEETVTTPVGFEARAVTQSWAASSVTWSSVSSAVGDRAGTANFDPSQTHTWTEFPVTGVVRDWVAGTRPNHGLGS
jgi:hypothetical protein